MTAERPTETETKAAPRLRRESTIATTPATVDDCQADYRAGSDVRDRFDATARRQYRA